MKIDLRVKEKKCKDGALWKAQISEEPFVKQMTYYTVKHMPYYSKRGL